MKIPTDLVERQVFYDEVTRQCTATRNDRFALYQTLRNYYLFGSPNAVGAPYNKIGITIDTLSSFIYSPDTLRFSLQLGTEASIDDVYKSVELSRETTEQWRASRTHLRFGLGLRWSTVFGTMLAKVQWSNDKVRSYLVEPHQFGVYREDVLDIEDQEAFTHHYTITRSQLEYNLQGNPRKGQIMARVCPGPLSGQSPMSLGGGLQRLILGSAVGGVPGSRALAGSTNAVDGGLPGQGTPYDYTPKVEAELIDMCDLYVWDDDAGDYRLATRAAPGVTIYDRHAAQVGLVKGVPAFVPIRAESLLYDYFWGSSFVARLAILQDWMTERVLDIRSILGRQIDPPWTISGGVGIAEEKLASLRSRGGMVSFPTPNAKAEAHPPSIPADVFAEISRIESMFDDEAGLGHVLQGKGEPGVRSRGQADLMARLGSGRSKSRAIIAEESAEDVARLILRSVQEHSDQRFQCKIDGKDLTFTAAQFTREYEVKVDAHSSSPIFVEDRKHDATTLFEVHAIDRETLLDMYDPPNLQDLKERLKKIEAQEIAAKKAEMAAQATKGKGAK